ncbi:MAG TPA: spore coat associated protein CotJA [Moorella mulderi]|nr:spore coat associated protein CotJA [Moorella mulderi]
MGYYRLARAYVPWQQYTQRWGLEEGLKKGTIFPELYRPYPPKPDRGEENV